MDQSRYSFNFRYPVLVGENVVGFFCVTGGVLTATALFYCFRDSFGPWQDALLYVPVVIACALRFGLINAIWGSGLSFFCWDFFLRNLANSFWLSGSRDCIALFVYVITAAITSWLASSAYQSAKEAEARAGEAKMLYMVSQVIGREIDTSQLLQTLADEVVRLTKASACAILRNKGAPDSVSILTLSSDQPDHGQYKPLIEQNARTVMIEQASALDYNRFVTGDSITRPLVVPTRMLGQAGGLYLPLHIDGNTLGLIYVGYRRDGQEFSFQDDRLILTLASQAAVVMARDRLTDEATKQAQQVAILGERNRLAKEVHDTLSHAFTGIRFLLEAAAVSGPAEQAGIITQAHQMAIDGAQEARRSVWALRPAALHDGVGLVKAINVLMKQQTDSTSISGILDVIGDERLLTSDEEDNLLRICQEALTNILRHSGATSIIITIKFETKSLLLSIEDNGRGFADHLVLYGFGIGNMRERSAQIGALFEVNSEQGKGTTVSVQLPLRN